MDEMIQEMLMRRCIQLAKESRKDGQYAIAALVATSDGAVIVESGSTLKKGYDPTNHPEMQVIRMCAEKMQSRQLSGCFLVTTLEPCPMCAAAAVWARMEGIIYGACQQDAIEYTKQQRSKVFSWRQIRVNARDIIQNGIPALKIFSGVLREECKQLFYL